MPFFSDRTVVLPESGPALSYSGSSPGSPAGNREEVLRLRYGSTPLVDPPFYLPEFEEAFQAVIRDYTVPEREIAIFIPCALRKPYSKSPSHRLFRKIIGEVFPEQRYHIVIFGTCGVVPAELEGMFPFAHYHFMLGKCTDKKILQDFLTIETCRLSRYLEKTRDHYVTRIAYCIGIFRQAMEQAVAATGVPIHVYPSQPVIARLYDIDCPFPEGSLSMEEYIREFREGLIAAGERGSQPACPSREGQGHS